MSGLAFHFAGGDAFFTEAGAILAGVPSTVFRRKCRCFRYGMPLAAAGTAIVALSGTPLPGWFYFVWGVAIVVWFFCARRLMHRDKPQYFAAFSSTAKIKPGIRIENDPNVPNFAHSADEIPPPRRGTFEPAAITVMLPSLAACLWELSFHFPPQLGDSQHSNLAVIGDSVSAGMLGPKREMTWPRLFEAEFQVPVFDFSQEGATAKSAIKQAAKIPDSATLVLIEIGGNDILGPTTSAEFAVQFESLLAALVHPERQIVMLELPLPPFYNRFGLVQRKPSCQFGVAMISKREFATVLATPNATLDGIHLSQTGHRQMAVMVQRHLQSQLEPKTEPAP